MCWWCCDIDYGHCDNYKIDCRNICCDKCGFILGGDKEDSAIDDDERNIYNELNYPISVWDQIKDLYKNHHCEPNVNTIVLIDNEETSICIECYNNIYKTN